MCWEGIRRVRLTWDRIKKQEDVNKMRRISWPAERLSASARFTTENMSVGNHQICSLLVMLRNFKIISHVRSRFRVICSEELKGDWPYSYCVKTVKKWRPYFTYARNSQIILLRDLNMQFVTSKLISHVTCSECHGDAACR